MIRTKDKLYLPFDINFHLFGFQSVERSRWASLPVADTITRIIIGEPYSLEPYRSLQDKLSLLNAAIGYHDGNAILTVSTCCLKGQYRHDQSRHSTGHGIGVAVKDEHSEWKLLARLYSSNGNVTLSCGVLFSVRSTLIPCAVDRDNISRLRLWESDWNDCFVIISSGGNVLEEDPV